MTQKNRVAQISIGIIAFIFILGIIFYIQTKQVVSPAENKVEGILIGAGDIADCPPLWAAKTTDLLKTASGSVIFTLGDNSYPNGSPASFTNCYGLTWGQFKEQTKPAVGNRDYRTPDARGYFDYFGKNAGDREKGYYSYNIGSWHVIVLNSNCDYVGGCEKTSPQGKWLIDDLAESTSACTLAYWHHPLFASNKTGNSFVKPFWETLYAAGAELVLNGHNHAYERFFPQNPQGEKDLDKGILEIIAGTGGSSLSKTGSIAKNSARQNDKTFGVLKLTLYPERYRWEFIPVEGMTFADSGNGACH